MDPEIYDNFFVKLDEKEKQFKEDVNTQVKVLINKVAPIIQDWIHGRYTEKPESERTINVDLSYYISSKLDLLNTQN